MLFLHRDLQVNAGRTQVLALNLRSNLLYDFYVGNTLICSHTDLISRPREKKEHKLIELQKS